MGLKQDYTKMNRWLPRPTKVALYRNHAYKFQVDKLPSSAHHWWTENDWIDFIDEHGVWETEKLPLIRGEK
jgi:hypothetical protein